MKKDYILTIHAARVVAERTIPIAWINRVMQEPDKREADKADSTLCHVLKRIPEYDGRVLRVVYNETTKPKKIVTVYFDRTQKGKL